MNITKQYIEELKKIAMNYECISGEIVMPILAELGRLLEGENVKKTIYNTLTEHEQTVILQYIADRICNNEIDVDMLPRWLMSLHEEHLELQKLKEEKDQVCEWIQIGHRYEWAFGWITTYELHQHPSMTIEQEVREYRFDYCPYCGKKITYKVE